MIERELSGSINLIAQQGLERRHINGEIQAVIKEATSNGCANSVLSKDTFVHRSNLRSNLYLFGLGRYMRSRSGSLFDVIKGVLHLIVLIIQTLIRRQLINHRFIRDVIGIEMRQVLNRLNSLTRSRCCRRKGGSSRCCFLMHLFGCRVFFRLCFPTQTLPERWDERCQGDSTCCNLLSLSQGDSIDVSIRNLNETRCFIEMNRNGFQSSIRARSHRGEQKLRTVEQGVLPHAIRSKRGGSGDHAQDIVAKHVFCRTHLDLIVSDPLEDRPLVLVALGRDFTQTPDAAVFDRSIDRECKDHTNTVWQEPLGVLANNIEGSAGFSLINHQSE